MLLDVIIGVFVLTVEAELMDEVKTIVLVGT